MTSFEIFIDNFNNRVDDLVLEQCIKSALLDSNSTKEEIKTLFSSFGYSKYITEETLRQCIDFYAAENRLLDLMDVISNYIKIHTSIIDKEKYAFVLELVISENGYKRMLGRNLWDEFDLAHSDINVLDYDKEVQGRFALSILQDMMFPQRRLLKLLSLFYSPFPEVRHILIIVLSSYTLNYFGTVKKMFEECSFNDSEELKLFKEYIKQCDVRFDMYHNCKELHSIYSLPDEYEMARHQAVDHLREQTKKSREEHESSFLGLFNQVVLGRGGGFRDDKGRVQPLGHYKFSQEMPMMLHGMSPLESNEYCNNVLFKDWRECVKTDETKNS